MKKQQQAPTLSGAELLNASVKECSKPVEGLTEDSEFCAECLSPIEIAL
jgi:hypothetical protein